MTETWVPCVMKSLPDADKVEGAKVAIDINPTNAPRVGRLAQLAGEVMTPFRIAALTTKFWGTQGVDHGVYFMDSPTADLKARILSHANAWGEYGNIRFRESSASLSTCRIVRTPGTGYASYVGVDCNNIPKTQPTMWLDSFSMSTSEGEYRRVVRHEFGHHLGFIHEHSRRAIVQLLDDQKVIALFKRTQGWSEAEIRQQILTPIEEMLLLNPPPADVVSIMTYGFPGSVTKSGQPIPGGMDIDPTDGAYCAKIYPKATTPPVEPPPTGALTMAEVLAALDVIREAIIARNPRLSSRDVSFIREYSKLEKADLARKFPGKRELEMVLAMVPFLE